MKIRSPVIRVLGTMYISLARRNAKYLNHIIIFKSKNIGGARWPSGRVSDSGARGRVVDTYLRRVVSLSKDSFTPRKVLVIPRKLWLCPDMTEKLLTGK